ncbi:hypothetical protein [Paractinoplanes lichenicola]|uniref:Uncharacterized protein n=1 Tax=Paractinoplanes lichenicola TaxID=2802976 RepID=A0ABS1VL30_9ACTN|nr:hypothetical protein [Actinoplanes lichenicola]MBL7255430.1 hypothetical protein [Actinoplanes lichenicola]
MIDPFEDAGALREAYLGVDWATTPLGPVAEWSPTLLSAVDMLLHTRSAVTLFWGAEQVMVYNEAYVDMIGDKHPAALGAPVHEVFAEIWDEIGPMIATVRTGAAATGLSPLVPYDDAYRGFLRLVAAALNQGLSRAGERALAEALQRSLLSHPAQPDHLQVAVRYQPAAEGAKVGGDWYDAFTLPDGPASTPCSARWPRPRTRPPRPCATAC